VAAHLTEEEQIEAIKRWWKDYGTATVISVAVALGGFFGYNQYTAHKQTKAAEASEVYQKFVAGLTEFEGAESGEIKEENLAKTSQLAQDVVAKSGSGLYAEFAELYLAKAAVQKKDYSAAKTHLEKVMKTTGDESVRLLTRLRLARVLGAAGELDAALALLQDKVPAAYTAAYAETKGDLLYGQNRLADARTAYEAAIQGLDMSDFMRQRMLQLKIDNTRTAADAPQILPAPGDSAPGNPHAQIPAESNK
jgi:predicted negative regulator of RcsB-dependent stress response